MNTRAPQKPYIYKTGNHWTTNTGHTTTTHNTWTQALHHATPPPGSRTCINCLQPMHTNTQRPHSTKKQRTTKLCGHCHESTDPYTPQAAKTLKTTPNTNTTPQTYKKRILQQHHTLQHHADRLATQHAMNTDPALARYITNRRKRLAKHPNT